VFLRPDSLGAMQRPQRSQMGGGEGKTMGSGQKGATIVLLIKEETERHRSV